MKGVVLAGGTGSRLFPLTKSINKHCLPVYDRPMIHYPIQSLVRAGITDIILVAGGNHMSQFIDLLGDGSELGCKISYVAQMKPGGIAEAISLVEPFVNRDLICVILGDNIFVEDISGAVEAFETKVLGRNVFVNDMNRISQCSIMCKPVTSSEAVNYGILTHKVIKDPDGNDYDTGQMYIIEKPSFPLKWPDRMYNAVTGLYMYTPDVFTKIMTLKPSARGELEVSELNDQYAAAGDLTYHITKKLWLDCGVSIDHMLECSNLMKSINSQ